MRIQDEHSQISYGYSKGCICCDTKDLQNDIKEIQFKAGYVSNSVTMCKHCRKKTVTDIIGI